MRKDAIYNQIANVIVFGLGLLAIVSLGLGAKLVYRLFMFGWRLL